MEDKWVSSLFRNEMLSIITAQSCWLHDGSFFYILILRVSPRNQSFFINWTSMNHFGIFLFILCSFFWNFFLHLLLYHWNLFFIFFPSSWYIEYFPTHHQNNHHRLSWKWLQSESIFIVNSSCTLPVIYLIRWHKLINHLIRINSISTQ